LKNYLKIKYALNDEMIEKRDKVMKGIKKEIHEWLTIMGKDGKLH
jgi:hypothetical protein